MGLRFPPDLGQRWHFSLFCSLFKLGHQKPIQDILQEPDIVEYLDKSGTNLEVDEIQLPKRTCIGFLLSPVPDRITLDQGHSSLSLKTIIKVNKVQFYLTPNIMRLSDKKNYPKRHQNPSCGSMGSSRTNYNCKKLLWTHLPSPWKRNRCCRN